ncbi:CsbD family protein [Nocardioides dubius]|uniref:CsbD family protein n=1 Tax=Nocardioides dubius TaxID=317019 RepID=A0ABP4EHC2_9ACTN
MGFDDKIQNKAQDLTGRGKEAVGAATDNESLKSEGQADQAEAGIKGKIEDLKDKAKEAKDEVTKKVNDIL